MTAVKFGVRRRGLTQQAFDVKQGVAKCGRRIRDEARFRRIHDFDLAASVLNLSEENRFLVLNQFGQPHDGKRLAFSGRPVNPSHEPFRIADDDSRAWRQRGDHGRHPHVLSTRERWSSPYKTCIPANKWSAVSFLQVEGGISRSNPHKPVVMVACADNSATANGAR